MSQMAINDPKTEGKEQKRCVSFNTRVTVVLIPERKEIMEAQCDLWWSRGDYGAFQQSAHSEIRLFALYENIDCKEAKTILYQPNQALDADENNDDEFCDTAEDFDMISRDSEIEEKSACPPSALMRHVDSVSLLSAYNSQNTDPTPMKKSMSSGINLAEVAKILPSASEDPFFYVSLCVPSKESAPLVTKEHVRNKAPGQCRPPRRENNGFAVALGIFSVTVPIMGYYLMHYSS